MSKKKQEIEPKTRIDALRTLAQHDGCCHIQTPSSQASFNRKVLKQQGAVGVRQEQRAAPGLLQRTHSTDCSRSDYPVSKGRLDDINFDIEQTFVFIKL